MNTGCVGFSELLNNSGQTRFRVIEGYPNNISEIICGESHIIILLACGKIFSCGGNEHDQFGHMVIGHIGGYLKNFGGFRDIYRELCVVQIIQ